MSDLTASEIFNEEMPAKLEKNAASVKTINAVYQFDIDGPTGGSWTVDLTKDGEFVSAGPHTAPNCTVKMKEEDFVNMWEGKLPGPQAFMMGKLKVQGDMGLAMKLQKLL
jgi:putative sterol carrier protein